MDEAFSPEEFKKWRESIKHQFDSRPTDTRPTCCAPGTASRRPTSQRQTTEKIRSRLRNSLMPAWRHLSGSRLQI